LFLHGAADIAAAAQALGLAALWVTEEGAIGTTSEMASNVTWQRS
jgi:hypothetical protein